MSFDPDGLDALRAVGQAAAEAMSVDVSRLLTEDTAADLPRDPTAAETALVRAMFGPHAVAVPLPGRLAVIVAPGTARNTQEGTT